MSDLTEDLQCPYCGIAVAVQWNALSDEDGESVIQRKADQGWEFELGFCPRETSCGEFLVRMTTFVLKNEWEGLEPQTSEVIWPRNVQRVLDPAVDNNEIRKDYEEAAAVLSISPQASAALSRRILQQVLRELGGFEQRNLNAQIEAFRKADDSPARLGASLHALRTIGNWAAHPTKGKQADAIHRVEPGEAEWVLDLLDEVFDHYFVAPAKERARRDALNERLASLGREPITSD